MSFASPAFLLLLPLALLPLLPFPAGRRPAVAFPVASFAAAVRPSLRRRLVPLLCLLPAGTVAAGVVALAGPRGGAEVTVVRAEGVDIQLVVDVSASMVRTDIGAGRSRLEVAVDVIDRFVRHRPDDRIGLLTFARYPRLVCPLTLDHEALQGFLRGLEPVADTSEEGSTAIGVALAAAVLRLREDDSRTRIVVLLTDGEEREKVISPQAAAELAHAHGIKVYGIALAARGGPWAEEVRDWARTTGGEGFVATDERTLGRVYDLIDELETRAAEAKRSTSWQDMAPRFVLLALLLLLLEPAAERLLFRRVP